MFWVIFGALGVVFTKYYTSVGSRKLHHRINTVKWDLDNARKRFKDIREIEFATAQDEEQDIQRVRFAKEVIDELQLRLTLSNEPKPVVFEDKSVSIHF